MRSFIFIFAILLTFPALAQGWGSYTNARYGATADIPPGFEPMGQEAVNSDGLIFRSSAGRANLTIYGASVTEGDFMAHVEARIAHEQSYSGWTITNRTITPDWAEYSGNVGGRKLRVRTISACGGRISVSTKFEFNGNQSRLADRIERSLTSGAC